MNMRNMLAASLIWGHAGGGLLGYNPEPRTFEKKFKAKETKNQRMNRIRREVRAGLRG
jgi:hypothetical protein